MEYYDFLIIGAGLFGIYASLDLNKKGYKVLLIDKDQFPYKKASIVNQARIHKGFHYPRSVTTAITSNSFSERFIKDHKSFVNQEFSHFYGIEKYGSLTNSIEFVRFADFLGLNYEESKIIEPFSAGRLEALFRVKEYSYDPLLLRDFYLEKLNAQNLISKKYSTFVQSAEKNKKSWEVNLVTLNKNQKIKCANVINSTYASINEINEIFKIKKLDVVNQLSEIVFIYSKDLYAKALTVMDGPYLSLMPYGFSGLHSLTSVIYTHHNNLLNPSSNTSTKNYPVSNNSKILKQLNNYLNKDIKIYKHGSLFTTKTKLKSSFIDDSRPTNISKLSKDPGFYQLFSGKISSIYEFEKLWN